MRSRLRGLYAITDARQTDPHALLRDVEQALLGGATILQYRDKSSDHAQRLDTARQLRQLTHQHNTLLIINDDVELAAACLADGVHLGRDDATIDHARQQLGPAAIIGVSCYNHLERARQAAGAGADYVAFGRFFPSRSKPQASAASLDTLQRAKREFVIPIAAIGGITSDNASALVGAGADMLAVINDLFAQSDIRAAAQRYQRFFENRGRLRE